MDTSVSLGEKIRSETYNLITQLGSVPLEIRAVNLLPEPRRSKELVNILKRLEADEENRNVQQETLRDVANLLPEPRRTEELTRMAQFEIDRMKPDGNFYFAREMAKLLTEPVRSEQLGQILNFEVDRGDLGQAQITVQLLGRKMTWDEAVRMRTYLVQHANLSDAKHISRLMDQPLSTEEITLIFTTLKKLGWQVEDMAREAADLLPEPMRTTELGEMLKNQVGSGSLEAARWTAHVLGRELDEKELAEILKRKVEYGNYEESCRVADLLRGEPILTEPEIASLLKQDVEHGDFYGAKKMSELLHRPLSCDELLACLKYMMGERHYTLAVDIADVLPEPERSVELKKILEQQIISGEIDEITKTAGHLGHKLTVEELTMVIRRQMAGGLLEKAQKTAAILLGTIS